MTDNDEDNQGTITKEEPKLPLLGNALIYLDTGFFKNYKPRDQVYQSLLQYSKNEKIILCTSELCLEEWRTQKVKDMENHLQTWESKWTHEVSSHCGANVFSQELILSKLSNLVAEVCNKDQLKIRSRELVMKFLEQHNIKFYQMLEQHIEATWDGYFHGTPPYKARKAKKDIPDAWIYEAAKDALSDQELKDRKHKLCISSDNTMCDALEQLGFNTISLEDLVLQINEEEQELDTSKINEVSEITTIISDDDLSPLGSLLSKALEQEHRTIWLHLLGFVEALDTPTHDELISNVATSLNMDAKMVDANAQYLASANYLKDTGNHYLSGNKQVCEEASNKLTPEIIKMLDLDS